MRRKFDLAKRLLRGCLISAVFASVVCTGSPAVAEDAVVEALIQRGIQLRRGGSDEQALAVFLEAEKQDPSSVRVLLHVVTAAQAAGKWLMADSYMRKVSALDDDAYYRRHAEAIDVVRRSIAQRIGTFEAQGEPAGATVRLDGQLVGTLPMKEPTSIEAGAYLMEVHKPGFYRLRRNVTINGGVLTREPVTLNQAVARGDLGAGAGSVDRGGLVGQDERQPQSWLSSPVVGWSLVGLGVASGVVSGVAFMRREQRAERWNDEGDCVPTDGGTRLDKCSPFKDDVETAQTIGVVSGVGSVLFLGLGVTQLVLSGGGTGPADDSAADTAKASGLALEGCSAGVLSIGCYGSF